MYVLECYVKYLSRAKFSGSGEPGVFRGVWRSKSRAPKRQFPKAFQADLGRPVLRAKIPLNMSGKSLV
jgi:hypothetical protein